MVTAERRAPEVTPLTETKLGYLATLAWEQPSVGGLGQQLEQLVKMLVKQCRTAEGLTLASLLVHGLGNEEFRWVIPSAQQ
jgi:hypothetical protein